MEWQDESGKWHPFGEPASPASDLERQREFLAALAGVIGELRQLGAQISNTIKAGSAVIAAVSAAAQTERGDDGL